MHHMPLLVAPLASLFFFSGFGVAQIVTAPNCSTGWNWAFNSLYQSPCTVAANILATCNGGSYSLLTLLPRYSYYRGPDGTTSDLFTSCLCSTTLYSLLSACSGCQGETWIPWSEYASNCTQTKSVFSFPKPVPWGTRIPQWALLDVTQDNIWNSATSEATGDFPELIPGTTIGTSRHGTSVYDSVISNTATSNTASDTAISNKTTSNTATPSSIGVHNSNVGTLAGGIVGGIVSMSTIVSILFLYQRRRRLPSSTRDDGTVTSSLPETITYNPNDPDTFSEYQRSPNPSYIPAPVSSLSHTKILYTGATTAHSLAQEYHGLPIV